VSTSSQFSFSSASSTQGKEIQQTLGFLSSMCEPITTTRFCVDVFFDAAGDFDPNIYIFKIFFKTAFVELVNFSQKKQTEKKSTHSKRQKQGLT